MFTTVSYSPCRLPYKLQTVVDKYCLHSGLHFKGNKCYELLGVLNSLGHEITQWLFVRHPYGDLYLLFVRESEDFIGFLCDS